VKTFNIFVHEDEPPQAVKVGWSWPGFLFTWIWALAKRMTGLGIVLFLLFGIAGVYVNESGEGATSIVPIAVGIWLGLSGNKQREARLRTQGFRHAGDVDAASPKHALEVWSERGTASAED
jgi:hypothetical protein